MEQGADVERGIHKAEEKNDPSLFSVGNGEGRGKNMELSRNGCVATAGPANS
jgi:hypothetical protein